MLNRAAPEEIVPVEIAAGPLMGMQMQLDLRSEKDYWLGTYEPELLRAIAHFVKPGQTAFDIGANIGYVSLAMAKAVGSSGTVVAFEPLPTNLARLKANLALNPAGKRVELIAAAVGAHAAQDQFLVHKSGGMGKLQASLGRDTEYEETLTVEVIALDDWLASSDRSPPDLIKIDVEGGEVAAITGMREILEKHRPTLLIELHGQEAATAIRDSLASARYSLHQMQQGYPQMGEIENWKTYTVALPR